MLCSLITGEKIKTKFPPIYGSINDNENLCVGESSPPFLPFYFLSLLLSSFLPLDPLIVLKNIQVRTFEDGISK